MKKISIFMLTVMLLFGFQTLAFAERQPVGETVVKDNMLFINGNSISAAQLPNAFVYVPVDDLEWYGFDVERKGTDDKRIYIVTRNMKKSVYAGGAASVSEHVGVYTTNAEVYLDSDTPANVFELENGTVMLQSDELAKYGTYDWDSETHTISITLKGSKEVLPFQPFHNAIGADDINEIKYGVIVNNTEKRCADIEYTDLKKWLDTYWDFNYERVIAPMAAFDSSGNYVKLWNEDKSRAYIVYPFGGIIAGKYGNAYKSHGEIKQNYVWYLPIMGNSRNALNSADMKLNFTYFNKVDEVEFKGDKQREFTQNDDIEIPQENLLYTDTASDWAKGEIDRAAACNLMVYDLFEEYTKPVSRLEFCRLAYQLIATEFSPYADSRMGIASAMEQVIAEKNVPVSAANDFSDCSDEYVKTLTAMGIISGMGDGTFAPDATITREQAAAILYRVAEFLGNKTMPAAVNAVYADEDKISDWAKSSVACMNAMGIMNGVSGNEFAPKQIYTAEQAVATMLRMYECN